MDQVGTLSREENLLGVANLHATRVSSSTELKAGNNMFQNRTVVGVSRCRIDHKNLIVMTNVIDAVQIASRGGDSSANYVERPFVANLYLGRRKNLHPFRR